MLHRLDDLGAAAIDRLPRLAAAIRPRTPQLGVTAAAGLLLWASFPPVGWWWTAILAFAALSWVLTWSSVTSLGGFGYGFLFGLLFYLPLLPWVGGLVGMLPWLVLSVMCAAFPAVFGLLAVLVRRLPGWPIWFAALWAAQEALKDAVPFGGFPWGVVGFGQANGPLLPLAAIGGVPLLSAAIVLLGCAITDLGIDIVLWVRHGHPDGSHPAVRHDRPPEVLLPTACICVVLMAAMLAWPQVRRSGVGSGNEPAITVAVVQGNVPRLGLDFNAQRREVLDYHVRETLKLADEVRAGRAPQPQLVIWPENSSDIDPSTNADAADQITEATEAIDAPILVGTLRNAPGWAQDNPVSLNSAQVWDPVDGPGEWHDKRIVQPFGEYLPWRGFFRHLSGYADRAGYFLPGSGTAVVHAAGIPVGVATCWEIIFDRAPRHAVLNGAQLLAVPTNNATFNQTMSEQQLAFAKVRAVEHDRYVVVAGTTGISAVIAPDGRELARTGFFQPAYLDTTVRLKTALTPATRWGPSVQWSLVGMAVASVLVGLLTGLRLPWPHRRRTRPVRVRDDEPDSGMAKEPDVHADDDAERSDAEEWRWVTADDDAERSDAEEWRWVTADDDAERSDAEEWRWVTADDDAERSDAEE